MAHLAPFHALRPAPESASAVASVPYDVVSTDEARALASGNPLSFLHVTRAEIDLPPETNPYGATVYAQAARNFEELKRAAPLVLDDRPSLYFYRLRMGAHEQTGVAGCFSLDEYDRDLIKKHEKTRKDKEDDRTRHVLALNANAEPVFLTFRDEPALEALIARGTAGTPLYDFTAGDGVRHRVWRVDDPAPFVRAFDAIPVCYVADGHHRSASAWRAGLERRQANPAHTGREEYNWFLAVLFPAGRLRILPYHRMVRDLNGQTPAQVLDRLRDVGRVVPALTPDPPHRGSFGCYLDGRWHLLVLDPATIPADDPIASLDAALLERRVLGPVLGIGDVRTDPRIAFVGGIRGTGELERRVNTGEMALAVSMYPVTVEQLMAVADAGAIMPPKTTWFEPKLRSGLFVHTLD